MTQRSDKGRQRRGPSDRKRGPFRPRHPDERRSETLWVYGVHAALAALANPKREILRIVATRNALHRLEEAGAALPVAPQEASPREIDHLLGPDTVHQGVAIEVGALAPTGIEEVLEARLLVVLDQVTDPHNVGAIMRSAAALGASAIITTERHAPAETAVLAKSASGAAEFVPLVTVVNLARALEELGAAGFNRIGLDSEGTLPLESAIGGERIALVLGAEGKGLRRLTRDNCDAVARLDMPGPIKSLNVSNAAALALYLARRHLGAGG